MVRNTDGEQGVVASIKRNPVVHVLFAFIFVVSGLIVNLLQAMTMILWWTGNKDLYRTINIRLAYLHWALIPFVIDWWAGIKITLYIKPEEKWRMGKESAVVIMNHKYDVDWAVGWVLCDRCKILGNAKCVMKSTLSYMPLIGWAWRFCEYIFVTRNLEHDASTIMKGLKNLAQFKHSYWMLLCCEGTRFTKEKHNLSIEYAAKKGIKPLKHHLLPRTGGFRMIVKGIRDSAPAVYDTTIYVKGNENPTLTDLLCGKSFEVDFLAERIPMSEIPEDDEECSEFIHNIYRTKDDYYDYCTRHNRFPLGGDRKELEGIEAVDVPRRTECLWIAISWALLILTPLLYYVWKLILSGSFMAITMMALVVFAASFVFQTIVAQGAVSKSSSSYGKATKSD